MMSVTFRMITLLGLVLCANASSKIRRKRLVVWEVDDEALKDDENADQFMRDLNVLQEGTVDIMDEDWTGFFDEMSPFSMSMSMPTTSPNEIYKPITRNVLNSYCRGEYGSTSSALRDGYDWYCKVTDSDDLKIISIPAVCEKEFSLYHREVLLGGTADDWACVNWEEARFIIVPVVVVASDYHSRTNNITDAVDSVSAAMDRVQSWYKRKMKSSKTFRLSRPILQLSDESALEWNELSCLTGGPSERPSECIDKTTEADRYGYLYAGQGEVMDTSLPPWPQEQFVPIFVYTGPDSDPFWLGAAAQGPYSVNPPNVAVCPKDSDDCGLYSIGHEMGHSFGLAHSCEIVSKPECYNGIMQNPPNVLEAVLFEPEQDILNSSPYFEN